MPAWVRLSLGKIHVWDLQFRGADVNLRFSRLCGISMQGYRAVIENGEGTQVNRAMQSALAPTSSTAMNCSIKRCAVPCMIGQWATGASCHVNQTAANL